MVRAAAWASHARAGHAHFTYSRTVYYRVCGRTHAVAYMYEEATWEPETNLNGCTDLLLKFEAKYGHDHLQHAGTPVSTKRALEIAKEASKKKRKNANTTSS